VFTLDFMTGELETIYKFKEPLRVQPQFFTTNDDQSIIIVSSEIDTIYVDIPNQNEIDLDSEYEFSCIKEIIFDTEDDEFYIVCNKYRQKLGFYVMKMPEKRPKKTENNQSMFLIKWTNKLDIGDTNIFLLRNKELGLKELVISYKAIFINTYNLILMDISKNHTRSIVFRHESFQLWESGINGILMEQAKDFVMLNRDGINLLALGSMEKKPIKDSSNNMRMIHSLESANYLKVDKDNYILFAFAKYEDRQIQIQ